MSEYNPFSLLGKNILITGASSGIGRAIAIECSKMGAICLITGRNEERLKETLGKMEGDGHQWVVADMRNDRNVIVDRVQKIDGVVHCAGVADTMLFQYVDDQKLRDVMEINFFIPAQLSRDLLSQKKLNKAASIIFISSISGVKCSWIGNSVYSASKGAINGLKKGMALDLASKGIRVNSVTPGMIDTDFLKEGLISEEQLEIDRKKYPLKRYGRPEEVAYCVIFLLSDTTAWITGSNLLIDGGYTVQ